MKLNEIIDDEVGNLPHDVSNACREYYHLSLYRKVQHDNKMQRYHDKICEFFDAVYIDSFVERSKQSTGVAGLYVTDHPEIDNSAVYITIKPFTKYIKATYAEDLKDIDEKTEKLMKMHGDYYESA